MLAVVASTIGVGRAKSVSTNINTNNNFNYIIDNVEVFDEVFNKVMNEMASLQGPEIKEEFDPSTLRASHGWKDDEASPPSLQELTAQVHHSSGNNLNINTNTNINEISVFVGVLQQILNEILQTLKRTGNTESAPPAAAAPKAATAAAKAVQAVPVPAGVQDTPEVEAAKKDFFKAYDEVKKRT